MSEKIEDGSGENPPFFRSWNTWYAIVLIHLACLILLFYWFTLIYE